MNRPDDVAIFWDYENCPVPSSSSGCAIANSITSLSRPFGSVKLFRAYLEIADQLPLSRSVGLRSELQSSGVSLIDCPHNGRKEVADKMIIVDMLAFAIDNPAPCTIVVISGDRDYAYALSVLKLRCYRMVLVTLPNAHTTLTAQASLCFDWSASVVNASVTPNNAVHPGPSSRYPIRHSHSQQPSLEPLSPPEYACQPPNLLPSTSPVGPEETPNITNFLQNRTHHRLSVSQTLPGGRSSSQPRAPERGIDNNATVTAIDSSRPPLAVPVATSPAPPLVADDASLAEVSNPLSYFRKEGRSGSTPGLLLSPNTVSLSTGVDLRNHDSVPTDGPVPESGSPGPSVHTVKLVEEVDEQHPTGTADVEDSDGDTDSSSGTTFIERPVSAPSTLPSLPQFATAPDATPVWLNGAQWEVDTPTNENTASFDNDSTPPSLQDVSSPLPVSPVKPRVIRSAGLPAFSFAAMARLQAVDLNKIEDAGLEPDIMPVISPKMIEPNRLSSLISVTNTTSTSPSSSAHYLTAPQTPQDKNVQLPDPNRTACPSPSSSTFPLPQTRIIPSEFVTLVQCLQMRIAHGHYRPLLTEVALQSAEVWAAASKTGSVGFGQNVNLAVKAGIIEMGGTERQPWISLKPEWHDAEPVLDSPDASNTPTASPSSSNPDPLRDGIDDGNKLDNSVSQDSAAEDLNSTQPNKTATLEPVVLEKDAEVPTPKKEQEAATIAIEHIALPSFGPQTSLDAIHPPIQAIEQPNPSAPDEPANITTDKSKPHKSSHRLYSPQSSRLGR
ncbi:NYN domain-containing protein [Crepidotus variabilis]|uniref:NYN domain-containing protein n=1 Tax=Crepidotus variabilis TaxID=179855 RepID=A0A9P6JV15_9AGAR|nr:NYN domain-containing protein [Crepidotus variabilis]